MLELTRSLVLKTDASIPRLISGPPAIYDVGRVDPFYVTDLVDRRVFTTEASLRLVSPHAYWYVENGINVSQSSLESAAEAFEEEIYPRVAASFGTEWSPGIDKDGHLTILHASLRGVAGYFSSADEYPTAVYGFSNQREMIYLNAGSLSVGSSSYLSVLAHELQHAVHWNGDPTEETWVNEGMSELAAKLAGYDPASQSVFLRNPIISLTNWPDQPNVSSYGASYLFFDYLAAHFGTQDHLKLLVEDPADGIAGIDSFLTKVGSGATFPDVFRNWVIANLLDEPGDGPYSYPDNDVRLRGIRVLESRDDVISSIPQYSAEYFSMDDVDEDLTIHFAGHRQSSLLPVELIGESCWWSNQGDSISSTLTRELDLTGVTNAILSFEAWYEIEEEWDFAYLEISLDEGSTWDIIDAEGTSSIDLLGNSFGPGYTGRSEGWTEVDVDLGKYTGKMVLLRFQYVTDESQHWTGICFDRIAVPQIGFLDDGTSDGGWVAEGFRRIDNLIPQQYMVQVVEVGESNIVKEMELDADNIGELTVAATVDLDRVVVVVAALAPDTRQPAEFRLSVNRGR